MAAEEIQKGERLEEVHKEAIREILGTLDWMFRLLLTSIQDVKNEIRWLADRLGEVYKDLPSRHDMVHPK